MQVVIVLMINFSKTFLLLVFFIARNAYGYNVLPLKEYDEDFFSKVRVCQPTSNFAYDNKMPKPEDVYNSNNLRRKSGEGYFASGRKIIITGRVLDSSCVPIPGVLVEIWQADNYGFSEYDSVLEDNKDTENFIRKIAEVARKEYEESKNIPQDKSQPLQENTISIKDPVETRKLNLFRLQKPVQRKDDFFNNTGRNVTNNVGEYVFLSVLPSMLKLNKTPVINFRVSHPDFGEIYTKMYFPCYYRSCSNAELVHYNKARDYEFMSNLYAVMSSSNDNEDVFTFNLVFDTLDKKRFF